MVGAYKVICMYVKIFLQEKFCFFDSFSFLKVGEGVDLYAGHQICIQLLLP